MKSITVAELRQNPTAEPAEVEAEVEAQAEANGKAKGPGLNGQPLGLD